jgi:hypothetical protein
MSSVSATADLMPLGMFLYFAVSCVDSFNLLRRSRKNGGRKIFCNPDEY